MKSIRSARCSRSTVLRRWMLLLPCAWMLHAPVERGWCGWTTYTTADGLAGNSITSILEDRSGNLWLGTSNGVARYDGITWKAFTTADGLVGNYVYSITEDRSGVIWFGMDGGVSRYEGSDWTVFPTPAENLPFNRVYFVIEDRAGNFWFGTDGGVSRFDGSQWTTYTTADGLGHDGARLGLEDEGGNIWVATGFGLSRYDGTMWRTFTTADGLGENYIFSMAEDEAGILWFGTGGIVTRYDGSAWTTLAVPDRPTNDVVHFILPNRAGVMWFATYPGVRRYNGTDWRSFTTADGLVHDRVTCMLQDHSANLWVGTSSGVSRFDHSTWKTITTADGLAGNYVHSILEDHAGNLWFGTDVDGVSRFDGSAWRTFTTADGLASDRTNPAFVEDRQARVWVGTTNGVSRYDGLSWATYTTADGLPHPSVYAILEDRSGDMWFGTGWGLGRFDGTTWSTDLPGTRVTSLGEDRLGNIWCSTVRLGFETETPGGVSRFDGSSWTTFTTEDGLADDYVQCILEDRVGNLWFGTRNGVSRFDGSGWATFTIGDGLADNDVLSMIEDAVGNLWFGTLSGGATRYDGISWRTFTTADGMAQNNVIRILEDRFGAIWFATPGLRGVSRYEPDRVAPQTLIASPPPRVTAARDHAISIAAFGEATRLEFSYRLDSGSWSEWSTTTNVYATALSDGLHEFEARSRDYLLNTDSTAALAVFEVDATPPVPVVAAPVFGQPVRGRFEVIGTAADSRFVRYRLEFRAAGALSWSAPDGVVIAESTTPVVNGGLGSWDTVSIPDGSYEVRLSVADSLGLIGAGQVTAVVDNEAPFADVTTPARVSAASGGDVYTTNGELRLYFSPRAFRDDAVVNVIPASPGSVPDSLAPGTVLAAAGYDITWGGARLEKPARLDLAAEVPVTSAKAAGPEHAARAGAIAEHSTSATLAIYHSTDGLAWNRVGGTASGGRLEAFITQPGRYALFTEAGAIPGGADLSGLVFMPRVFSPEGRFADREVGIGFTLGRAAPVTVRVYNRAGRLIREVASDEWMNAGSNLVRWDGRYPDGAVVDDGLYIVTVEALGRSERKPLAVVR